MDTVLEHRNTIRHAIFLSSLTVGEKNHSQCSSRVSQQITMHLSQLGGAPGPFSVECTKQEPALNTSSWGQWQPVNFRDHSPYLLCLRCGSPRVYSSWLHPSPPQPSHSWSQSSQSIWFWDSSTGQSQTGSTEAADSLPPLSPKNKVYTSPFSSSFVTVFSSTSNKG